MDPRHDMRARDRSKLPRVGAGGGIVATEDYRAACVDRRDARDDYQLGTIGAARHDNITDAQASAAVDGTRDHERAGW